MPAARPSPAPAAAPTRRRPAADPFQRLTMRSAVRGMVPRTLLRLLAGHLAAQGVPPGDVLPAALLADASDPLAPYPAEHYCQLLLAAARRLRDPLLGLHLGQAVRPAHLGAMGYVLQTCDNLGGVLLRIQRYHRLLHDINPIEPRFGADELVLAWGVAHGRPGALFDESGVTAIVEFARRLVDEAPRLRAVDFVNPPPADARPFTAYFGCPVRWGQPVTRLVLPLSALSLPLARSDPALLRLMEEQMDKALAALPEAGDLAERVRRIVANLARHGIPDLEQVAAALKLSPRVFYRRLAEQGCNFRELRDSALCQLAETHLADTRLSLAEVAQLLGYAEPSAFSRAFRRWRGCTPMAWRQGQGARRSRDQLASS